MIFGQIEVGNMQNFCYVVGDEETKDGAIVDAGFEPEKLIEIARGKDLEIKYILLTHTHYDHVSSLAKLFGMTSAKIIVHEEGAKELENFGMPLHAVKDGDKINIGKLRVKVIYTPGHSPSNVCYLVESKLLTGDTLFVEAIGRVDLPGGDIKQMFNSLQKLKKLSDDIEVYPGHDYGPRKSSTIGYEKKNNSYMKASKEEFFNMR